MKTSCKHYDTCKLPVQTCNSKCAFSKVPEGWRVQFNPKPIPDRQFDYDFWHEDADDQNGLHGNAPSVEAAAVEAIEMHRERIA